MRDTTEIVPVVRQQRTGVARQEARSEATDDDDGAMRSGIV
jgi:hypothetical protein